MAAINDLIARIQDPELRLHVAKEVKELTKHKKFGLVFENHVPEMTLLYDYPISRGCKVIRKVDDDKRLTEDILWEVMSVCRGKATCHHSITGEELQVSCQDLICVAKNGEPIYPCLKYVDSVQNAPDSDLWHTLIEADNFHALQLLAYLYPQQVDCIYIDPPYNSGATDWKYNNNYVDGNDSYRHSKWLAMMKSRLLLTKKLLNPKNSVLIVTIDEKEYLHLGCLLEEMFPEANIQMVSTLTARSGAARFNSFSRTNEFVFFVMLGDYLITPIDTADYSQEGEKIHWRSFRRGNPANIRTSRPSQFYPIYINKNTSKIEEIGEPISYEVNRFSVKERPNCVAVFPVRDDGTEMLWGVIPEACRNLLAKGYIKATKYTPNKPQLFVIQYLSSGTIADIENGKVVVKGYSENGGIIADNIDSRMAMPKTQWSYETHDERDYGSKILKEILGENRFSFPKSLYAVHDAIRFFVANNPNALILDFFSGSGTTLHAVNLLNKEDGGHRRCIMVTNNEVSAEEEKAFRAKGLHKGDEEWEKFGIARYVNWPRTKCSILGVDVNGKPIQGDYITSNTEEKVVKRSIKQISLDLRDDSLGAKLKKQIVGLIGDKKMPQNAVKAECPYLVPEDANNAILFDVTKIDGFMEDIHESIDTIYVVTSNNKAFTAAKKELDELPEKTKTVPVTIPMAEGFVTNAAYYKLTFLDKDKVSLGTQLNELLPILWMKAGAHGVCPTHVDGEFMVFSENKMAVLNDEFAIDELKEALRDKPEVETVYIIEDSEENYRTLAASLNVKQTYQLYRDYLDNFKINIERKQ